MIHYIQFSDQIEGFAADGFSLCVAYRSMFRRRVYGFKKKKI